ncbi:hypothetical protein EAH72_25965 [Pseudomonas caspiana]|uniref:Uncharacterized protein n=1 Tax=Pseudomonas mandelii TaxID=75612 RepID=A0A502HXG1_9PSED|nr:hypothetical protein EAH74_27585 [Pseudomonas mandelii]TPG91566.1 hypothetical protein EAH72_25965 [Pseudomonas caspiana]
MGASLLAIAPDQSILMSPDTPLSRASSLPQGYVCAASMFTVRKNAIWRADANPPRGNSHRSSYHPPPTAGPA